ncbi:MAG: ABC transporter substrate-binding protein [Rhodospirillales bacterium]|nr:ABC transporter substrate-binding protein [Rhodospirillales bacterium]
MTRRFFLRGALGGVLGSFLGAVLGLALLLAGAATPARASVDGARDFIRALSADAVAALDGQGVSREALQKLIETGLDVDSVGRFALGPFLRQSNPQKVDQYLKLFRDYVLISYPDMLAKLKLRDMDIVSVKSQDEHVTFVTSRIGYGEKDTVEVGWYVREVQPNVYKIQDVQVSGNSLRLFQRAKFEKILRDRWIDGLIKVMERWVETGREDPVL